MKNCPLPRLDEAPELRERLLQYCRLRPGDTWSDPRGRHRVACLDAADPVAVGRLMAGERATLAIQDPPYNFVAFAERSLREYVQWCERWVRNTLDHLADDAALYVWLGADQANGFQPLPDFMLMMRDVPELAPRSFITVRNQRGYGTQRNWMAVRQELLYYTKGSPPFTVQYTEIPKVVRGYYKELRGEIVENLKRSKSPNLRPGNVWIDIQQVFYRMEENVSGCYAQKPLEAIERILAASSSRGDRVLDLFSHSGTTLLACETSGRRCLTADLDPVFCEITIRRLERYRASGARGWQNGTPFPEIEGELTRGRPETDDPPQRRSERRVDGAPYRQSLNETPQLTAGRGCR
jgi:site-specific DNA-methyltransferase (adenine-specific)